MATKTGAVPEASLALPNHGHQPAPVRNRPAPRNLTARPGELGVHPGKVAEQHGWELAARHVSRRHTPAPEEAVARKAPVVVEGKPVIDDGVVRDEGCIERIAQRLRDPAA